VSAQISAPLDQPLPAGTWQVDPSHSSIEFRVKHMRVATVRGRFTAFEGTVAADEHDALQAHGTIQTASIQTDESKRDERLRSPEFFDAASYPEISFHSTEIVPSGATSLRMTGELTIKGITRPVVLSVTVGGVDVDQWRKERAALKARGEIDRKEFGLTWNQALETGGVLLSDLVEIAADIVAVRLAPRVAA